MQGQKKRSKEKKIIEKGKNIYKNLMNANKEKSKFNKNKR